MVCFLTVSATKTIDFELVIGKISYGDFWQIQEISGVEGDAMGEETRVCRHKLKIEKRMTYQVTGAETCVSGVHQP
jgi:hypothetical protein